MGGVAAALPSEITAARTVDFKESTKLSINSNVRLLIPTGLESEPCEARKCFGYLA
jgi:hypothetical protein